MIRFDFIVGNLCEGLYICFVFVGIFVGRYFIGLKNNFCLFWLGLLYICDENFINCKFVLGERSMMLLLLYEVNIVFIV